MNPRSRTALACLALSVACTACGVGAQSTAQLIDPHDVPRGLLSPTSTTTTVVASSASVTVYFEGQSGLVPVVRHVRPPASISEALAELMLGPASTEGGGSLQSPVSTVLPLVLKGVDGSTAVVSVPTAFTALGGKDQIVAAAQLVFTVTAVPGVDAVTFLVDGQPAQVPVSSGNLQQGPLTRADFAGMLAP